ncbi:MAG: histidine phosphatase family protein [Actinomycetota bacterium]|nr:histidine phosphatase family protein [Actinomycetota bacterium]
MAEQVWIARHGETEWSLSGQHTGTTDLQLTDDGVEQARALGTRLADVGFTCVLTSPSRRARHTAELAGFGEVLQTDDDLSEMRYGAAEGRTTAEMQAERPGWASWDGGSEGAESLGEMAPRVDRVVERLHGIDGRVLVVGHGHASRVLAARWVGITELARHLVALPTGHLGILAFDHGQPAIRAWSIP